jgi:hypothetical protein
MSELPTSPVPIFPIQITQVWNTILTQFDGANEQSRQKQAFAKYDVTLRYEVLSKTEIGYLWNFFIARGGAYEAFYFYTLPETEAWSGLYIGVGDGSTVTFDIPGKSTSAVTIYNNGEAVSAGDYTLLTGGGAESADRVTFDTAPAEGDVISCSFTGYMRVHCRFKNDRLERNLFTTALYTTGLELKGIFP